MILVMLLKCKYYCVVFHFCSGAIMSNQSYIRICGENGRLSLSELANMQLTQVYNIELHQSGDIAVDDWLSLVNALPNLSNLELYDSNGKERAGNVMNEIKLFNFIKGLQALNCYIQTSNNHWLTNNLYLYKQALVGIFSLDHSLPKVVELTEHLTMTLDLINNYIHYNQSKLDKYLSQSESLFADKGNKGLYETVKQASLGLLVVSSVYLVAVGLICSYMLPFYALGYMQGAHLLPMVIGTLAGSVGLLVCGSEVDKIEQKTNVYQASKQIGLFFYPRDLVLTQPIVQGITPSAPMEYNNVSEIYPTPLAL